MLKACQMNVQRPAANIAPAGLCHPGPAELAKSSPITCTDARIDFTKASGVCPSTDETVSSMRPELNAHCPQRSEYTCHRLDIGDFGYVFQRKLS